MKLLVEIPEEQYRTLNAKSQNDVVTVIDDALLIQAIKNGIPLPKGHGNLIDKDALIGKIHGVKSIGAVLDAPIIIGADKEYEAEVITRGNCMMCGKELDEGLFFCKECEQKQKARKEATRNDADL